jgi:hypothetical protein
MARFPDRSEQIFEVFQIFGAGTVARLAEQVMRSEVFPDDELRYMELQSIKIYCARVLKQRDAQGRPRAIITPDREGRAHVWKQLEFATFEDCRYKLACDIAGLGHDYQALMPLRDFIEEKFAVALSLPTYGLMPGQDPWWKPVLDQEGPADDDDDGYTVDPEARDEDRP